MRLGSRWSRARRRCRVRSTASARWPTPVSAPSSSPRCSRRRCAEQQLRTFALTEPFETAHGEADGYLPRQVTGPDAVALPEPVERAVAASTSLSSPASTAARSGVGPRSRGRCRTPAPPPWSSTSTSSPGPAHHRTRGRGPPRRDPLRGQGRRHHPGRGQAQPLLQRDGRDGGPPRSRRRGRPGAVQPVPAPGRRPRAARRRTGARPVVPGRGTAAARLDRRPLESRVVLARRDDRRRRARGRRGLPAGGSGRGDDRIRAAPARRTPCGRAARRAAGLAAPRVFASVDTARARLAVPHHTDATAYERAGFVTALDAARRRYGAPVDA